MKNWWHYHKWYVICGILLLLIFIDLTGNAFGWFKKSPDLQIAYVGEAPLPEDTVTALKKVFSSLAGDYNHDGEVLVQINQFASGSPEHTDAEAAQYRQASKISLIGDINDCESYFFLMDNPAEFQKEFQVLAMPDGSCPDDMDFTTEDKVFQWKACSLLSEMDLGSYTSVLLGETSSGKNQEILSELYLGRRCFYGNKYSDNIEECGQLWDTLKGGLD